MKANKSKLSKKKKSEKVGDVSNAGEQYALAAARGAKSVFQLVPATQNFAKALHDPFTALGMQVKMPILPVLDTQTVVNYVNEFTFNSGSNGQGYVLLAPAYGAAGALPAIYYTDSTNTFTAATPFEAPQAGPVPPANGVHALSLTSQYTFPNFYNTADGLRVRIVAAGIEVECTSPTLVTQGVYHSLVHPNKENLLGQSHNDLGGYLQTRIDNVITKGGATVVRITRPILNASDTRYLRYENAPPTAGFCYDDATGSVTLSDDNNYWMGISVAMSQSLGPGANSFRGKVFVVTEVYGKIMASVASRAVVDQPGYDAVVSHHASVTHNPLADMRLRLESGARATHKGYKTMGSMLSDIGKWVMKHQSGIRTVASTLPLLMG